MTLEALIALSRRDRRVTRQGPNRAARRSRGGRVKRPAAVLAVVGVSAALSMALTTTTAGADTCTGGGYYWAGKESAEHWLGVEGNISVDTESMETINQPTGSGHILNYIGMTATSIGCGTLATRPTTECFISPGTLLGSVSGNCKTASVVMAYMEENDRYAYDCQEYPPGQISLEETDFYSVFYTGQCTTGYGLTDAYVDNGSGMYLIGQAWLPHCASSIVHAQTEFLETAVAGCPTLTKYEHFGAGTHPLYESPNGSTWTTKWTGGEEYHTMSGTAAPPNPLSITPTPPTSTATFKTWG